MDFAFVRRRPWARQSPVVGKVEYTGPNHVRHKRQPEQEHQKHEAEPHQDKICIVNHRFPPFPACCPPRSGHARALSRRFHACHYPPAATASRNKDFAATTLAFCLSTPFVGASGTACDP